MKHAKSIIFSFILFLWAGGFLLFGESADQESEAQKSDSGAAVEADISVTVTASRTEKNVMEVPGSVVIITESDLKQRSIPEALRVFAGMDFKSFNGSDYNSQPSLRGFTENGQGRVLFLVDGIRVNNPDMSALNWLDIPRTDIKQIEVMRGGGSALYGDFAVAAVVNIITKKPLSSGDGLSMTGSTVSYSGGSGSLSDKFVKTSLGAGPYSLAVSASDIVKEGWRDRTGIEQTSFSAKLGYNPYPQDFATLYFSAGRSMFEMPGSLKKEEFEADPRKANNQNDEARVFTSSMVLDSSYSLSGNINAGMSGGISSKLVKSDIFSYFTPSFTDSQLISYTLQPSFTVDFPFILSGFSQKAGADFYLDTLDIKRFAEYTRSTGTFEGEISKYAYGIYSRSEAYIFDTLLAALTVRYDNADYKSDLENEGKESISHSRFAWSTGLSYFAGERGKIYFKYDSIFRYPFLDEQIYYSGFGSDGMLKNLKPEKGHSFDTGFEYAGKKYFSGGINFYYLMMKDEIALNDQWLNENLDRTVRYGGESFFRVMPDYLVSLSGSMTISAAEFRDGVNRGKEVPMSPKLIFTVVPELNITKNLRIYSELSYTGEAWQGGDNANTQDKIKSYMIAGAGAELTYASVKSEVAFYGKVSNITDKNYAPLIFYSGYYPGSGREIEFGASVSY